MEKQKKYGTKSRRTIMKLAHKLRKQHGFSLSVALKKSWAFAKFIGGIKLNGTATLRVVKKDGSFMHVECDSAPKVDTDTLQVSYFDSYAVGMRSFYINKIVTT